MRPSPFHCSPSPPVSSPPGAAAAGPAGDRRAALLDQLRHALRSIERTPPALDGGAAGRDVRPWTTGAEALDHVLGPAGLDPAGLHEIRPGPPGDWCSGWAAAQAFALALTGLRSRLDAGERRPVLWCAAPDLAGEIGLPYLPGLVRVGIAPEQMLLVLPRRGGDVPWAIEEGLNSDAVSLVVGVLDGLGLTPARRLALAAARHATPCLLLTDPRRPVAAAVATRWAVSPAPSGPHPLSPRAPGPPRLAVRFERSRDHPLSQPVDALIEWCDEAFRFHMAAPVADRADAAHPAGPRAARRRVG